MFVCGNACVCGWAWVYFPEETGIFYITTSESHPCGPASLPTDREALAKCRNHVEVFNMGIYYNILTPHMWKQVSRKPRGNWEIRRNEKCTLAVGTLGHWDTGKL